MNELIYDRIKDNLETAIHDKTNVVSEYAERVEKILKNAISGDDEWGKSFKYLR